MFWAVERTVFTEKNSRICIFLRKIVRGGTDDSYGIDVARLSGIPDEIIRRAKQILLSLENGKALDAVERDKARADMIRNVLGEGRE